MADWFDMKSFGNLYKDMLAADIKVKPLPSLPLSHQNDLPEGYGYEWYKREAPTSPLPRNRFGVPLCSPKCQYCTEHEESTMVCDLCFGWSVLERMHGSMGAEPWIESFDHQCPETHKYLNLVLCAIVM